MEGGLKSPSGFLLIFDQVFGPFLGRAGREAHCQVRPNTEHIKTPIFLWLLHSFL